MDCTEIWYVAGGPLAIRFTHIPSGAHLGWPVITFFQKSQGFWSALDVLPGVDSEYRHKNHELEKIQAARAV